eukprot:Pgem_evm1s3174
MILAAYIPLVGSHVVVNDVIRGELAILFFPFLAIAYLGLSSFCFFVYLVGHPKKIYKGLDYPWVGDNSLRPAM